MPTLDPIAAYTPEQELANVRTRLERMPWYRANGYTPTLPDHDYVLDLAQRSAALDPQTLHNPDAAPATRAIFAEIHADRIAHIFVSELYDASFYQPALDTVS